MSTPADNRFAPPKSHVADVSETESTELAGRGSRLVAAILDGLIFLVPLAPIFFQVGMAQARGATTTQAWGQGLQGAGILLALGLLVELAVLVVQIVFLYKYSATIGKRIVGIKIVRTDGSRASFSRVFWLRGGVNALISYACALIPVIGRLYWLVDVLFIFGSPRRCVHDYIADTIVVKA